MTQTTPETRGPRRRGTATVELAVCLPVLTLLVFGSMQACDMIYLKHGLTTAAYEGSLEIARPDANNITVSARIKQVLGLRGVTNGTYFFTAAENIQDLSPGDPVTISITAPVDENLMVSGFFGTPSVLTVNFECTR
ncbi:TadE-like protein [Posidoniimonas polymericola]|uniref:TadE-like protein n=1 Tax=Posidoniimonas polymericola TaxID=2528002 RepID=A0A5C5ZDW2_9BACT|nr:TadE family protein [Posidoniimonas polymericola]TWT85609.1 TadE-like protein [Posidoniimonas polymericola]